MYLIIGLGNPGLKYRKTRHNIGFMVLDYLQKQWGFSRFKQNKIAKADITTGSLDGKVIFLAKPQTYMNNSGFTAKFLTKENGFDENSLIIVHDDFDLPLGEVRVSQNSGSGGHRGIDSIIQHLKTQNFTRVRIGIGQGMEHGTWNMEHKNLKAEDFVLKNFNKQEQQLLHAIFQRTEQKIQNLL